MKQLIGNCYVDYDDNNKLWAIGFENEYEKNLVIPDGVYGINYEAFKGYYCLETLSLPDSLETIGQDAFYQCSSLRKICLPSNVKKITGSVVYGAFGGCLQLVEVDLSSTKLEVLPSHLFDGCRKLQKVILPQSLKKIEKDCFIGCSNITSLEFNEGLIIIEKNFEFLKGLSVINLPDSVVHIEDMRKFYYDHIKTIVLSNQQLEMFKPYLPENAITIVRD